MRDDTVWWRLDLVAGAVYAVLVPVLVLRVGVSDPVRAVLALPFLLFAPGYAFLAAVYPERWSTDERTRQPADGVAGDYRDAGIAAGERVVLSLVASAALTPLVALLVNFSPFEIQPAPMFVALSVLAVALFAVAFVRRFRLPAGERGGLAVESFADTLHGQFTVHSATLLSTDETRATSRREVAMNVLIAVAMLSVLAGAAFAYTAPTADQQFTEFYVTAQNDSGAYTVTAVPSTLAAGEEQTVYPTVTNEVGETHDYTVVVELQRLQQTDDGFAVESTRRLTTLQATVPPDETARTSHRLGPFEPGSNYRVTYLLYRGEPPSNPTRANAHRSLRLMVDVTGDGTNAMRGAN